MSPRKLKTIDFKEIIKVTDIIFHYGELPEGLYWNIISNEDIIGIYFDEKDENRLYTEIQYIMYYISLVNLKKIWNR
jgi:hypothetical protein